MNNPPPPPQKRKQQQQVHHVGSVRHLEKRRIGTCRFADRVAQLSIDTYHQRIPQVWRDSNPHVCISTIVAHFSPGLFHSCNYEENDHLHPRNDPNGHLQVMALGVGTKFLSQETLHDLVHHSCPEHVQNDFESTPTVTSHCIDRNHYNCSCSNTCGSIRGGFSDKHMNCYGHRVRDCHAEILARRAFRRQLNCEMMELLYEQKNGGTEKSDSSKKHYRPILQIMDPINTNKNTSRNHHTDGAHTTILFHLIPGVTLHMYTSSSPCGDASWKKFAAMTKEKFLDTLGLDEWPTMPHEPIVGHALDQGQFALLVKHDRNGNNENLGIGHDRTESVRENHLDWCPPVGTAKVQTTHPQGSIHTCSDKICRWNILGLQGSLLSTVLAQPLYLSGFIVGRKFTRCICQRAICCRARKNACPSRKNKMKRRKQTMDTASYQIDHNHDLLSPDDSKVLSNQDNNDVAIFSTNTRPSENNDDILSNPIFTLHHPSIMCTSVYLNDMGVIDMSGVKMEGMDVRFSSRYCWVWWPYRNFILTKTTSTSQPSLVINLSNQSLAECIDGNTGLAYLFQNNFDSINNDCVEEFHDMHEDSRFNMQDNIKQQKNSNSMDNSMYSSAVCTHELVRLFSLLLQIIRKDSNVIHTIHGTQNKMMLSTSDDFCYTLEKLRFLKRNTSVEYEQAKDELLSNHRIFRHWIRREFQLVSMDFYKVQK